MFCLEKSSKNINIKHFKKYAHEQMPLNGFNENRNLNTA